MDKQLLHP